MDYYSLMARKLNQQKIARSWHVKIFVGEFQLRLPQKETLQGVVT